MRGKKPFAVLHYTQNTIILCLPNILCIGRTAYLLSFMNRQMLQGLNLIFCNPRLQSLYT